MSRNNAAQENAHCTSTQAAARLALGPPTSCDEAIVRMSTPGTSQNHSPGLGSER